MLKFSPNGNNLLSIGSDQDHSLAIYEWSTSRLVTTCKIDKSEVTYAIWKND